MLFGTEETEKEEKEREKQNKRVDFSSLLF